MTKEIDLLSLSKSTESKSSNTNSKVEKKEGLSLFDSLIVNNQKDTKDTKEINELTSKDNTTSKKELTKEETSSDNKIKNPNENKNELKSLENASKSENKENTTSSKENIKTQTEKVNLNEESKDNKTPTKTVSLLDRMILESKKNVKTVNKDELSNIKIENNKLDDNKLENTKNEKTSNSLLSKMISDAKSVINDEKKDLNIEKKSTKGLDTTKNEIQNDEKTLNKEEKVEVKKNQLDIKENVKVISESKNNNLEKTETKSILENGNNQKVEKLENKTNISKTDVLDTNNTKEIKVENSSIEKELKNSVLKDNQNNQEEVLKEVKKESLNAEDIKTDKKELEKVKSSDETILKKSEINPNDKILDNETQKIVNKENRIENQENSIESKVDKNIKNETLSKELFKLDSNTLNDESDIEINISKKDILKQTSSDIKDSTNENKSLMDRLLDNAKKSTIVTKETMSNQSLDEQIASTKSNDILTNIFLGTQKKSIYDQMLSNKNEGLKVIKEGTGLEDVKKSAEILDLGLKKTSVEIQAQTQNIKINKNINNDALLDRLAFDKNSKKDILNTTSLSSSNKLDTTTTALDTNSSKEVVSNLNVSPSLALSIQNRIIGAQQLMSSMMSDAARSMYQNYKPPVTAFRINLFPSQLGSIAILMKNDKDNAISISMNMSNSNTMDAFVENQNVLKEALNKNFNNNETTFNLDFNLEDQNPNQKNQQEQEEQESEKQSSTNDILESINQNQDVGKDLNYL